MDISPILATEGTERTPLTDSAKKAGGEKLVSDLKVYAQDAEQVPKETDKDFMTPIQPKDQYLECGF